MEWYGYGYGMANFGVGRINGCERGSGTSASLCITPVVARPTFRFLPQLVVNFFLVNNYITKYYYTQLSLIQNLESH